MSIEVHNSDSIPASIESDVQLAELHYVNNESSKSALINCSSLLIGGLAVSFVITNHASIGSNYSAATAFNERNDTMSALTSELTDYPLRVNCDDTVVNEVNEAFSVDKNFHIVGFVESFNFLSLRVSPPVITVSEYICNDMLNAELSSYHSSDETSYAEYLTHNTPSVDSLFSILHEVEHTKQVFNEAEATCYAIQKLPITLEELGLNNEDALALARHVAQERTKRLPLTYFSDECISGGDYDLRISDSYIAPPSTTVTLDTLEDWFK